VDADGAVVTITQSLGETAGIEVPGTGMWMNNLLGEADVNPPAARIPAGARLQTMCTPVIVEHAGGVVALGSSGSSRIRSAVLNGIVARVDHGAPLRLAVDAPRVHVDEGQTLLEGAGRPAEVVAAVEAALPEARIFREPTMFFGGMNAVATGPLGVEAAGDRRRGGAEGLA
jgi:gamma-glutamyltranspeptidase/glutathione hydrolase